MKKWIDLEFDVKDVVFLKTDVDQRPRIVVSIWILETGIKYELGQGTSTTFHYGFEMSGIADLKLKTTAHEG